MPTATITLPDDVRSEMRRFSWVNWSDVAREAIKNKKNELEKLEKLKKIISKSKFTEKDAEELSKKVRESMHKRLKEKNLL